MKKNVNIERNLILVFLRLILFICKLKKINEFVSKEEIKMKIIKYLGFKKINGVFNIYGKEVKIIFRGKFYISKCIYKGKSRKWIRFLIYKVRKNK